MKVFAEGPTVDANPIHVVKESESPPTGNRWPLMAFKKGYWLNAVVKHHDLSRV